METTKTWDTKPGFERSVSSTNNKITGEVSTTNKIYGYVSDGTKDHFVRPKNANALRFNSKYSAKTSPGRISARGGGRSGNIVFSKGHMVKGIKARKFDKQIKDLTEDRFKELFFEALDVILED